MSNYHKSVLLNEVIEHLHIIPDHRYIDGTLGGGGHSLAIAQQGGKVLGIDVDDDALAFVKQKVLDSEGSLQIALAKGNFRDIDTIARHYGFEHVDGVLLDLGVSSYQLDTPERGFSLAQNGPLDMRMDATLQVTAKDLINGLTKNELTELFTKFGEERFAKKIAGNIVAARAVRTIETTKDLEEIVRRSVPRTGEKIHPATRVFQALRIAVNDELNSLRDVLPKALSVLSPGGRIAVITFHSLEDRIVKHCFLEFSERGSGTIVTKKPVMPSEQEIADNPRSRSSKLRVFEKI